MNVMTENRGAAPALSPPLPSDIETLLRGLADRLDNFSGPHGRGCNDLAGDGQILLDVEVGDVRFLALRLQRPSPVSQLSPREQEIARMVASGYPNKTIASILEISSWTVASHLRRIFIKLEVPSRAAMATRLSVQALSDRPPAHIDPGAHAYPAGLSGKENEK
jgi:DNA-binding CsgD family transcriptional regulator